MNLPHMHEGSYRHLLNMHEGCTEKKRHRQHMHQVDIEGKWHLLHMNEEVIEKNGSEEQTIDYVFKLLDIPRWYYAIAILLGVVAWRVWKKPSSGLLTGYVVLLLAETVLIRKPFSGQHFNPELFWSWRAWNVQRNQILTNVIMFVPVGVLAGRLWKWRGLWVTAGLSVVIEVMQLVSGRGLCEFDDVMHNCFGAVIGVSIVILICKLVRAEDTE